MLTQFWEEVGGGLGEQWVSRLLRSSLVFWSGGLLAWVSRQPNGWQVLLDRWATLTPEAQIAVLVGALLAVIASSAVMEWAQFPLLQLMEGYWPLPRLRLTITRKVTARLRKKQCCWQELNHRGLNTLNPRECLEYAALDREVILLHPAADSALLPTALGNRLRAAEEYPEVRYGLNAVVTWPRLWPLLPEAFQVAVGEARGQVNAAVRIFGWGLLFCIWGVWAWWTIPVGGGLMLAAWLRALSASEVYGNLLRAAFDLHRFALYEQLRWPLPEDTAEERAWGERLTVYLYRGLLKESVPFTQSPPS